MPNGATICTIGWVVPLGTLTDWKARGGAWRLGWSAALGEHLKVLQALLPREKAGGWGLNLGGYGGFSTFLSGRLIPNNWGRDIPYVRSLGWGKLDARR